MFGACPRTMLHEIEFYYATSLHLFYNPLVCSAHSLHMNDHHYIRQIRDNDGNHVDNIFSRATMPICSFTLLFAGDKEFSVNYLNLTF